MAVYLISFIISYLFTEWATICKKNKGLFFICSFIAIAVPAFIAGVRDVTIGTDTVNYIYIFEQACSTNNLKDFLFDGLVSVELGFSLYTYIISCITKDIYVFQFITHFTIIGLFYAAIMRFSNVIKPKYGILIFLLLCFNESLNITRQYLSLGFIILAMTYLMDDKKKLFYFLISIAVIFHYSAALAVMYYPLKIASSKWSLEEHKTRYLILLVFSFIILYVIFVFSPLQTYFMSTERYSGYFEKGNSGLSNSTLIVFVFMIIISYPILKMKKKNYDMLYAGSVVSLILIFASVFTSTLYRVALVYEVAFCLSVPIVLQSKQGEIIKYVLFGMLLFYWFFVVVIRGSYSTFPYQSVFLSQLSLI